MHAHPTPSPSCSLDGHTLRERVASIAALHARALVSQQRDGRRLVLAYADGFGTEVAEMVAQERECCAFLDFQLLTTNGRLLLTVTVPEDHADLADTLLAPFDGSDANTATSCCGACMPMNRIAHAQSGRTAGAIAATAGTLALACGVCCVLPIAVPAIALTSAGGVLAWFGSVHAWVTWIALAAVVAGWLWIGRFAATSKARIAPTTLWLMGIATLALGAAGLWPLIEPTIVSALRHGR